MDPKPNFLKGKKTENILYIINREIFINSLIIYLFIFFLENFYKGFLTDVINTNWLILIIILSGLIFITSNYFYEK